jgi:hypothetical protein
MMHPIDDFNNGFENTDGQQMTAADVPAKVSVRQRQRRGSSEVLCGSREILASLDARCAGVVAGTSNTGSPVENVIARPPPMPADQGVFIRPSWR